MKIIDSLVARKGLAAAIMLCGALTAGLVRSQVIVPAPTASTTNTACGHRLSEATYSVWRDLGGETGRLGCATTNEAATSPSPLGSAARAAVFSQNGEIVLHVSGPRTGQAYAVLGCFYRLYAQFSGSSGWLGLPIGDQVNTADGSTQAFEGGTMRYTRAYSDCEANPSSQATPASASTVAKAPLDVFENATGDRLSLAAAGSVAEATTAGYHRVRGQARVLTEPTVGAMPLKLYRDETRDLWRTTGALQSERDALAAGFVFEASQGFVWADPRPGALPLRLFEDPATGRTRLVVSSADEADAKAAGDRFVRIEGYVEPPS